MHPILLTAALILLPFFGTSLGAAAAFFVKAKGSAPQSGALYAFAAGVMAAAAVWSLLLPSLELSRDSFLPAFFPAAVGFLLGALFCLFLDRLLPFLSVKLDALPKGKKKTALLIAVVTLHNLPEGMAVGVICAGLLDGNPAVSVSGAFALSLGVAIQNVPEGAIVSLPLRSEGKSRTRSFLYGVLSGAVEPVGALITLALTAAVSAVLPYMLSFAAGAMTSVVTEELIPRAHEDKKGENGRTGAVSFVLGFLLMMILDVALG